MADVMQQNGNQGRLIFLGTDFAIFGAQHIERLPCEVHRTDAVIEPAVHRARIHQRAQCQLLDAPQPLKDVGVDQVEDDPARDLDEPVYWVVDDLILIHRAISIRAKIVFECEQVNGNSKINRHACITKCNV